MKNEQIEDLSEEYEGDNPFIWMLKAIHALPAVAKYAYIDPLIALGKATTRRPKLVNRAHAKGNWRRSARQVPRSELYWFFDDPKGIGRGYIPIWHYIPRRGFVDAHEGARYHKLLDGKDAVDIDVLDASNRDLEDVIKTLKGKRKKRIEKGKEVLKNPWKDSEMPLPAMQAASKLSYTPQKENKKMKITKEELVNIIKEEVEKALSEKGPVDTGGFDEDRIAMELSKAEAMMKAANEQMQNPEKRASLLKTSLELYQRACNLGSIKGCQAIPKVKKMIEKPS